MSDFAWPEAKLSGGSKCSVGSYRQRVRTLGSDNGIERIVYVYYTAGQRTTQDGRKESISRVVPNGPRTTVYIVGISGRSRRI